MLKMRILLLFVLCLNLSTFAQKQITGAVKDTKMQAIPGVSVSIKGTVEGTITDINGNYSISIPGNDAILLYSFIGMESQEIAVGDQSKIDVILEEELSELNEVVVVGYGVQKKKLITGATSQVKGEEIQKMNSVSVFTAVQGKTPGVSIVQNSGKPGEGFKVNIRGVGTVGDASPLYIVDGIETDIDNINPSDIESFDVLKDGASAAIYGARGANGVIIVTTKSGKSGKTQLTYDAYYGVQNMYKSTDYCNATQFMALQDIASLNSTGSRIDWDYYGITNEYVAKIGTGTNWMEEALNKNAPIQSHTLSMSGGTDQGNYSASISYSDQEGIIGVGKGKSNYERYGFRLNSEQKVIGNVISFGQHLYATRNYKSGIETAGLYNNNVRGLYYTHPLLPVRDENGDYVYSLIDYKPEVGNPIASIDIKNENLQENNKIVGDVYFKIEPFEGLTIKTMYAVDYYSNSQRSYTPNYGAFTTTDKVDYNQMKQEASHGTKWTFENTATYIKRFGLHNMTAMIGTQRQNFSGEWMNVEKQSGSSKSLDDAYLNKFSVIDNAQNAEGKAEADFSSVSYFGRVSYDYNEKYMATVTVRRDGSSRFGAKSRFGTFPSFSAGWLISNEEFFPKTDLINHMKIRGSWGQNGNDKIGDFRYYASIADFSYYPFGTDDSNEARAAFPGKGSNEKLRWETSEQINIGLDAQFIDNHLNFIFDAYKKITSDWLVDPPNLDSDGVKEPFKNSGQVTNSGIELSLTWNDQIGDLSYSLGVNGAFNKNKVDNIPNDEGEILGDENTLWQGISEIYLAKTGYPIGFFYGYETDGIFDIINTTTGESEADHYTWTNPETGEIKTVQPKAEAGDVKYVDRNDNGRIDPGDRTEIGNPHPDFSYGLNLNVGYKGFDLAVSATGVMGNQIARAMADFSRPASTNYPTEFYANTWNMSNRNASLPKMRTGADQNWKKFSDLYIEDGDYFRIQNVTFGYELTNLVNLSFLSQFRIYVQAQNLLTITKYSGMDPEIGYAPQSWASGVDMGYFPHPRTYLVGVNLKF